MSVDPPESMVDLVWTDPRDRPLVLHVDDDVASLLMAEGPLEDGGFDVVHAHDGLEAVAEFESHVPDLIIMDAMMPNMDGFQAIARIREHALGAHVPILMITGLDDLASIQRAYHCGATDFLTKPVNFQIVPHRVRYMLRGKRTADALRISEAKLDNAQRIARLGHWEWRVADGALTWSQEFGRMLGLAREEPEGHWQEFLDRAAPDDRVNLQYAADHAVAERRSFHVEFTLSAFEDLETRTVRLEAEPRVDETGRCTHMLGTLQDITERTDAQRQIHNLAYFDLVTGLPNRARLAERLNAVLQISQRHERQFALLFLDLDHFKQVNDTLGHDAGDELLRQVSTRLQSVVRDTDLVARPAESDERFDDARDTHTVARLGGDEFVVLMTQVQRADDAARVAERIARSIGEPYELQGTSVNVTTTVGISLYPEDGTDAETLMKHADVAMYHAKEQGRNGYQFYSRAIHERSLQRFRMENALKQAIANDELSLVFQPKIELATDRVVGAEALVRWEHPEFGTVPPMIFIPLAEETDLILAIGRWVLHGACQQMCDWIERGVGRFSVAVNCSPVQFARGDVISGIESAITATGLDPTCLEIELTESFLLHNIDDGVSILERLKALGIRTSIDDFGTGFSSLSYLKRLPVDTLKIDQSFVRDLETDAGDAAIVSAIVTLSHNLSLSVVAEGVETVGQLERLREFGCDEVQGYLIGRPLTAADFERWLDERKSVGNG